MGPSSASVTVESAFERRFGVGLVSGPRTTRADAVRRTGSGADLREGIAVVPMEELQ